MAHIICGVDIGAETLDARIGRDGAWQQFVRTNDSIDRLAAFCRTHQAGLVVMEATGGYERLPFHRLWERRYRLPSRPRGGTGVGSLASVSGEGRGATGGLRGWKAYSSHSTRASHDASMMFSETPIDPHDRLPVGGVQQHARHRAGPVVRIENPDLVVDQLDLSAGADAAR